MDDRFSCGFLAGFLADIVKNILSFFSYNILHFTRLRYIDFSGILLLAHKPVLLIDQIVSLAAEFFWSSLLGAVFAMIIVHSPKNKLFKSTIFGIFVWFSVYTITHLYKVPELMAIDTNTAISNLITSSIYGLLLGLIFQWFEKNIV